MTTQFTVTAADNGIFIEADEWVQVIENTHNTDGVGYDNLIKELGKMLHDEIDAAMNQEIVNKVNVKLEITKGE